MSVGRTPVAVSWSGGKDSTLALERLSKEIQKKLGGPSA